MCGTVAGLPITDSPDLIQRLLIGRQLSETAERLPEAGMPRGLSISCAMGQFECHHEDDHKRGFMHIYLQAPHLNTEFRTPTCRAEQAIVSPGYAEINGLTQHQLMGSNAGPIVLTLRQAKQDNTGTAH